MGKSFKDSKGHGSKVKDWRNKKAKKAFDKVPNKFKQHHPKKIDDEYNYPDDELN